MKTHNDVTIEFTDAERYELLRLCKKLGRTPESLFKEAYRLYIKNLNGGTEFNSADRLRNRA